MTFQQSVAVIGAGGPSGSLIVDRLLAENIQTIAVVRSPAKYADRWPADHKKLKVVQGDVTDAAALKEAVKNCTHIVFAASGQTYFSAKSVDFQGVRNAADAAFTHGAHVILISSALTSPHNRLNPIRILLNNIRWSLMDYKYAGEEVLRSDKRIKHTVLRPAGLTNDPAGDAKILIPIQNINSQQKTVEVSSDKTTKPGPDDLVHLFDTAKTL